MDPYPVKVSRDRVVMITGFKLLPLCNNRENRITAVYVCGIDRDGKVQTYERKYTAGWSNGKIYCEDLTAIAPRTRETSLADISDLSSIREYERNTFGFSPVI